MRRVGTGAILVVLLSAPLFLAGLGRVGLSDPDEGRNAEVAREMLARGDWVTPHLNDARYLDKPPVFFWAAALSYRLFGVNEAAARLPSALAALLGIGMTVWFATRRLGARAGIVAGALLALSPLYVVFGRLVIFDMLLLVFTTAATLAAYEAMEAETPGRLAPAIFFAAAAAGTLTKGPVALIVPVLVAVAWALARRQPGLLLRLNWGSGLLIYIALIAPWLWLAEAGNPGFLRYALLGENLARMTANPYDTQRPFHFYLRVIFPGLFPRVVLCLVQGTRVLWRRMRQGASGPHEDAAGSRVARFAFVWLAVLCVFFSLVASKRPSYVLPCAIPVALLAARLIVRACEGRPTERSDLAWGSMGVATFCLFVATAAFFIQPLMDGTPLGRARNAPLLLEQADLIGATSVALLVAALAVAFLRRTRRAFMVVAAGALPFLCMVPLARVATREIETLRSSRSWSRFLEARLKPEDVVVCFEEYRPGLNFYLRRPIHQVTRTGRVFTSNYIAANLEEMRRDPGFRLMTAERLRDALLDPDAATYVLTARKEYGPLFEMAGVTLVPIREAGGFGLLVPAAGPPPGTGDADPPVAATAMDG